MTRVAAVDRLGRNDLAVVLITRNQVWNVRRLVRSVRELTTGTSVDLVLVDSASDDGTVEAALDLGVRVVELDGASRLTAAAGRLAGQRVTSSDYLLFLDGDMELVPGWLEWALATMRSDMRVAGIAGRVVDLPIPVPGRPDDLWNGAVEAGAKHVERFYARYLGGAALYRRSALNEVGSFDAALFSEEEPELSLRLRGAGYKLLKTSLPMVLHYTAARESPTTTYGRWRRNLYMGVGQVVRKHLGHPILFTWIRERGLWIAPALALLAMVAAFGAWLATSSPKWILAWVVTASAVFGGLAWRRRSAVSAAHTFLKRLVHLDGLVRGFFLYPAAPASEPHRVLAPHNVDLSRSPNTPTPEKEVTSEPH